MNPLPARSGQTRRELLTRAARLGAASLVVSLPGAVRAGAATPSSAAVVAEPRPPGPPYKDTDYWAFADWCQPALEQLWDQASSSYGGDGRVNAGMLVTHSIAALSGHKGPTRQDQRARMLVARMLQSPPYRSAGAKGGRVGPEQRHTPGFVTGLSRLDSFQHVAVDPEMAEGLVFAWRARHALSLPQHDVAAIEHEVAAIASGPFFRYPSVRLNQCNWPAEMYAYAAEVAGRNDLLRDDYRRQLSRFLHGCERPVAPWHIPNLSPSYSFHRDPLAPVGSRENIESSEYANLVLGIVARYAQAKAAGMAPLPPEQLHTLRAWIAHAIPAYWTHGGYLNWDTGLFLARWHAGRYWAFALDGLLAIASAPRSCAVPSSAPGPSTSSIALSAPIAAWPCRTERPSVSLRARCSGLSTSNIPRAGCSRRGFNLRRRAPSTRALVMLHASGHRRSTPTTPGSGGWRSRRRHTTRQWWR